MFSFNSRSIDDADPGRNSC